jgi:hypothetical protein
VRPVREREQTRAGRAQFFEQGDGFVDHSAEHLLPAFMERADQFLVIRRARDCFCDPLLPRTTRVLTFVPLGRAHLGKEALHPLNVAAEQLSIKMARVPIDQHIAEIEHDGVDRNIGACDSHIYTVPQLSHAR